MHEYQEYNMLMEECDLQWNIIDDYNNKITEDLCFNENQYIVLIQYTL